jgi:hypothetical protein
MFCRLSENESDMEDRLSPSIHYLQKLGVEHTQQVFESSRWIFDMDPDMAFEVSLKVEFCYEQTVANHGFSQIFTSEDVELPCREVANYLEGINPKICARYLEYIINERHEVSPEFHDRLANLYLSMTLASRKRGDESK